MLRQLTAFIIMTSTAAVFSGDRGGNEGTECGITSGPDVIVGDIRGISNYSAVNGVEAYAVGTESCNIGTEELWWYDNTNQKPTIGSSLYRYKDGRFEQLGMSWLKHGFYALSDDWCGCGCVGTNGDTLGVGCSDLYSSSLNGSQTGCGPRFEVNAWSGQYPYPATDLNTTGNGIFKRLQVAISDLDPTVDGGGTYLVEAQYVTPDDAGAGNHFNNNSHRYVSFDGSGSTWNMSFQGETVRERAALRAWKDLDPSVTITDAMVFREGLFIVGSKATNLGDGRWSYEYAVQNMNSDRSCDEFIIPFNSLGSITNIEFHDVDYHSGSPIDGTDWTASIVDLSKGQKAVSWKCTQSYEENEYANAIRWGTTYNFRFIANIKPALSNATLGLFKPPSGTNSEVEIFAEIDLPTGDIELVDCNENGIPDNEDIGDETSSDCHGNGIPDECEPNNTCPAELELILLSGPTDYISPIGATISVQVNELIANSINQDAIYMSWKNIDSEPSSDWNLVPMAQSGGSFVANLGSLSCDAQITWYVEAISTTGRSYFIPSTDYFYSLVGDLSIAFSDNGEVDNGWTVSGDATDGQWNRGAPEEGCDRGNPQTDADGSGQCYLTDNGPSTGCNTDVDGGETVLTTPIVDATISNPILSYSRWINNTSGSNPGESTDGMTVEFSIDGGNSWLLLESVGLPDAEGGWYEKSFSLSEITGFIPSNEFMVRFIVADLGGGSVVEAGVDNFNITSIDCENQPEVCPTDLNGDGFSNLIDLLQVVSDFGCVETSNSCPSDVDGDGVVNLIDLLEIISAFGPCSG